MTVSLRFLIADDNKDAGETLAALLSHERHEVRLVHDGRRAVDMALSWEPDVVVLDLQMPEMTGLDVQRYLKMVYPSLSLPVVMITAHDEPGSAESCLAAGVAAYMRKPVESTALVEQVRSLIRTDH